MISLSDINYSDPKTWELIQAGLTAGGFQMESRLVQSWLKKLKPKNIWELSAVVAIVRPGPLKSGFAESYLHNIQNPDQKELFNQPVIDDIFKTTEGVMLYQEQIMQLGARLAWNHLSESERGVKVDKLRKAVGKKNQKAILEIGHDFVKGCIENKIEQSLADKLFEIIKNCGRYAFNLSHSIKYAKIGYQTIWFKANYTEQFYCVYLNYAKYKLDKWEELEKIVDESRILSFKILKPDFNLKNSNFQITDKNTIVYGLSHIKYGPSTSTVENWQVIPQINNPVDFAKLVLGGYGVHIRSNTLEALVSVGAFSVNLSRKSLLSLCKFLSSLTDKEAEKLLYVLHTASNLEVLQDTVSYVKTKPRQQKVKDLLQFLKLDLYDDPAWIANVENSYMGVRLTASAIDGKSAISKDDCSSCYGEFPDYTKRTIAIVIDEVIQTTTKKGKNPGQKMARIKGHDSSGKIENLPVFPDLYLETQDLLRERNTVLLNLYRKNGGWIVENINQL